MLDAGRKFNRAEFWTHVKPWEAQRKLDAGQQPPQFFLDHGEQPYHTLLWARTFRLIRVWGRGGKTNVWGTRQRCATPISISPAPETDGWEIPWPIRYKDIAPYYDRSTSSSAFAAAMTITIPCPAAATFCRLRLLAAASIS